MFSKSTKFGAKDPPWCWEI